MKVIADDTFQITQPFFQDGVIAQAVDRAKAAGVTYLVSAGNRARQSWEGTYAPTTDPRAVSPSANDFDTGAAADAIQTIGTFSINRSRNMFVALQWDEPFGQASTDLAVDVFSIRRGVPTYAFTVDADNIATGIPSEFVVDRRHRAPRRRHLDPPQDRRAQPVHEVHRRRTPGRSRSPSTPRTRARSTPTPRRRAAR